MRTTAAVAAPAVTIDAPERVEPPLTVWDVAFASAEPSPSPPTPGYVVEVRVGLRAPSGLDEVVISLDGPGMATAISPSRFERVPAGGTATTSFRWAAPLRAEAPPYDLTLTASVTYADGPRRGTAGATRAVAVPAPPPPTEDSYLSDLPLAWAHNGFGPLELDTANGQLSPGDGGPIRLDGRTYAKGLGMNALGIAGYHLGGSCTRFAATVGIDDVRGNGGSVIFRVVGDRRVLFESPVMTGATPAQELSIDVTGVRQLDLVADPTPDGQGNDGADWADARVEVGP